MSDQDIMQKLKKFTVKELRERVGQRNKKYKDANPYKGYSTAKKDDLIKMIMANKNDFKDMVKIQQPITVESMKKKEEKKAVKKSVDKKETKKAEPVKKPVTKTAQKGDVQGVTSKKESKVDYIKDYEKFEEQSGDITDKTAKQELPKLLKKVKTYFNKHKEKMTKIEKANFKNLIIDLQDEIDDL